jgi:hypothetical protein
MMSLFPDFNWPLARYQQQRLRNLVDDDPFWPTSSLMIRVPFANENHTLTRFLESEFKQMQVRTYFLVLALIFYIHHNFDFILFILRNSSVK